MPRGSSQARHALSIAFPSPHKLSLCCFLGWLLAIHRATPACSESILLRPCSQREDPGSGGEKASECMTVKIMEKITGWVVAAAKAALSIQDPFSWRERNLKPTQRLKVIVVASALLR
eukprot:1009201-Rhodomonas_salina.2